MLQHGLKVMVLGLLGFLLCGWGPLAIAQAQISEERGGSFSKTLYVATEVPQVKDDAEAKKLFDAMEQKLLKVQAYKVNVEVDSELLEKGKGVFIVAKGNRANIVFEGTQRNDPLKYVFISDGKKFVKKINDQELKINDQDLKDSPVQDNLHERLSAWQARVGAFLASFRAIVFQELSDLAKAKLSGFKMLAKQKVGESNTQVIEYDLDLEDSTIACKLWLDVQSGLPLKRTLEFEHFVVTEVYSKWALDPKLQEDAFNLPK